jgi:hypothetical protein
MTDVDEQWLPAFGGWRLTLTLTLYMYSILYYIIGD